MIKLTSSAFPVGLTQVDKKLRLICLDAQGRMQHIKEDGGLRSAFLA